MRNGIPATAGICITITRIISYPDSNTYLAFWDFIALAFNMTMANDILCTSCPHVECSFNWHGSTAFCSIKSEIPTFTALVTSMNTEITSIEDSE
jgi:hypothetical protein